MRSVLLKTALKSSSWKQGNQNTLYNLTIIPNHLPLNGLKENLLLPQTRDYTATKQYTISSLTPSPHSTEAQ